MACVQRFMDTAELLYIQLDESGRVTACNPYAAQVIGGAIIGEHWFERFVPEDARAALLAGFRQTMSSRQPALPANARHEILTRGGERRQVCWNVAFDGDRLDWVGADVTEAHRLQMALESSMRAAQEASASKSRYVAQMSHELRTPLNSIIGFSDIMRGELFGPMPEAYREYSDLIHRSAHHLHRLIDDILDMAKIEASKLDLAWAEAGLGDLVDEALALVSGQAMEERVILRRLDSANPRLKVDPLRAEQVLVNILSNAIKFAPGTTVAIAITSDAAGHHVVVADRGIGMTADEIRHAVQPFNQTAAGEVRRRGAGSGLGLPLARSLMELHGGSLAIGSERGLGTTVTLTFPAEPPPA